VVVVVDFRGAFLGMGGRAWSRRADAAKLQKPGDSPGAKPQVEKRCVGAEDRLAKEGKGWTVKEEMATVLWLFATAGAQRVRRLSNPETVRCKKTRVAVATKTREFAADIPRKSRLARADRGNLTVKETGGYPRSPGSEKRRAQEVGSSGKTDGGVNPRESSTTPGKVISQVIPRKRAMTGHPLKAHSHALGKEVAEREPDREKRRREKKGRARRKARKRRERVREKRKRGEGARRKMRNAPLKSEGNCPNLRREARGMFPRRRGEGSLTRTNRTGKASPGSAPAICSHDRAIGPYNQVRLGERRQVGKSKLTLQIGRIVARAGRRQREGHRKKREGSPRGEGRNKEDGLPRKEIKMMRKRMGSTERPPGRALFKALKRTGMRKGTKRMNKRKPKRASEEGKRKMRKSDRKGRKASLHQEKRDRGGREAARDRATSRMMKRGKRTNMSIRGKREPSRGSIREETPTKGHIQRRK